MARVELQTKPIAAADLPPAVETASSAQVARMFAAGHSYAYAGGGASYPDNAWFPKTGKLLGCTRYDTIAQGGSILSCAEGDTVAASARYGGLARLLQFGQKYDGTSVYRTSRPYLPAFQAAMLMWGINDLGWMGPTTLASVFPIALTSAIQRLRAGAVFEDTDASVAYTGASWSTVTRTDINSGAGFHSVTSNGDSLTITVPADFPGGTIALRFVTGAAGQGALWTVAGTGCAAGVNTTYDSRNINGFSSGGSRAANGLRLNSVLRLTGLPAGAGTITATATTINTNGYFDCWEIESPTPPLVCLPLMFRAFAWTAYSTWPYQPVDADVATINTAIAAAAANFDANVFTVATDATVNKQQAYFENNAGADNLHPNDLGCAVLASLCVGAIRQQTFTQGWTPIADGLLPDVRYWYPFSGAGPIAFQSSWVDFNTALDAPAGFFKDHLTGRVYLRGHVSKTTGNANDIIVTLPAGYRPSSYIQRPTMVNTGSAWQIGMLVINNAGAVSINFNGSIAVGALNVIQIDFPAEQ